MRPNPEKLPRFYEPGLSVGHVCSASILHLLCKKLPIYIALMESMYCNLTSLTAPYSSWGQGLNLVHGTVSPQMECQAQKVIRGMALGEAADYGALSYTGPCTWLCFRVWPSALEQWKASEGFEAGKMARANSSFEKNPPSTMYWRAEKMMQGAQIIWNKHFVK